MLPTNWEIVCRVLCPCRAWRWIGRLPVFLDGRPQVLGLATLRGASTVSPLREYACCNAARGVCRDSDPLK